MAAMRILSCEVDRAAYVIDAHDAASRLHEALGLANQGRPRVLSLRTFLIGGLLATQHGGSFKATSIHRVLTEGIARDKQYELGIRYEHNGSMRTLTCDHVYSMTKLLTGRLSYLEGSAPDLNDEERQRRRDALQAVLDALLDGSIIGEGQGWYALDGSGIWAWGRGRRRSASEPDVRAEDGDADAAPQPEPAENGSNADVVEPGTDDTSDAGTREADAAEQDDEPATGDTAEGKRRSRRPYDADAAWGHKTAKAGDREMFFGYMLDAIVRIPAPNAPAGPVVAERMVLSPANADVVTPSLQMIDAVSAKGQPVTNICIDRHYSYKKSEHWAAELLERDINQHLDLRQDEQGFRDYNGMRHTAGWMHCPATPDHMDKILRPGPTAPKEAQAEFKEQIARRQQYAMGRSERTNTSGRSRWVCPAIDGRIGCPEPRWVL